MNTKGHLETHDSEGQTGKEHRHGSEGDHSDTRGMDKFHDRSMGHLRPGTGLSM